MFLGKLPTRVRMPLIREVLANSVRAECRHIRHKFPTRSANQTANDRRAIYCFPRRDDRRRCSPTTSACHYCGEISCFPVPPTTAKANPQLERRTDHRPWDFSHTDTTRANASAFGAANWTHRPTAEYAQSFQQILQSLRGVKAFHFRLSDGPPTWQLEDDVHRTGRQSDSTKSEAGKTYRPSIWVTSARMAGTSLSASAMSWSGGLGQSGVVLMDGQRPLGQSGHDK